MVCIRSFHQYLSSMVLLFTFILKLQSDECVGDMKKLKEGQKCCSNHRKVGGYCRECEIGYYGNGCSKKCEYPSFGLGCQDICNCMASECDYKYGCRKNESTTAAIITTASSVDTFDSNSATSASTQTSTIKAEKTMHQESNQENNTNDNKFVVPLSVTVSSSALIVLVVVLSKFRGNNKGNVIYYVQNPENNTQNNTPQPSRNQVRVPFRNLETDIYMDIEELDEMDEISNTSCRTIPNDENYLTV